MITKTERTATILTALIVLFIAMLAPWLSIAVSMVALAAFGIYKFVQMDK